MIKLQPNTFSADLLPVGNPRQKIMSEEDVWRAKVNEMLKGSQRALNAPNVVSQAFEVEYLFTSGSIPDTGIYGGGVNFGVRYLQDPASYKLTNINDINLRTSVTFTQAVPSATAPTPTGSYSMFYYTTIAVRPSGEASTQDYFLVLVSEFQYDSSTDSFSFVDEVQNYRLSDAISERPMILSSGTFYPSFLNNPTQITTRQYDLMTGSDLVLNITSGFDQGQLGIGSTTNPVLSANNKAHFEYFLYADGAWTPTTPFTYFDIKAFATFTYSGLFANYTPVDNA